MFGIKTKIINKIKGQKNVLRMIRIDPILYRCNNNCVMCWRNWIENEQKKKLSDENKSLKTVDYLNLIADLPKTVEQFEIAGGGEPMLFEKIDKIFEAVKKRKIKGSLITNGILLNKKVCDLLIEIGWDKVRFSLNAGNKDVYRKICGTDNFEKVVSNIDYLVKNRSQKNVGVGVHFVIQKENFLDIKNFIELAKKLGVDEISFDYTFYEKNNLGLNAQEKKKAILVFNNYKDIKIKNNINETIEKLEGKKQKQKCEVFNDYLEIHSDGVILFCCFLAKSDSNLNIKDVSIKKVWEMYSQTREMIKKGKYPRYCRECEECRLVM